MRREHLAALVGQLPMILSGVLFFASGVAALLYQIAWQRTLFGWYGVDLDSVSAIVSIFMLGLGGGALVGGWLADRFAKHRILVFALVELTIGLFGLISLDLIDSLGAKFSGEPLGIIVLLTFAVFLIPTCAMGATLPVLVTELASRTGNIGASTGLLYFINTLGAAAGAYAASHWLLRVAGLDILTYVAAGINITIALAAFAAFRSKL
ncbi:MAG: fused MFS/spermidine synthase [Hyphomicrobiaceae bacterium]